MFFNFKKFFLVLAYYFSILIYFFQQMLDVFLSSFYPLTIEIKNTYEVFSFFFIVFHMSQSLSQEVFSQILGIVRKLLNKTRLNLWLEF